MEEKKKAKAQRDKARQTTVIHTWVHSRHFLKNENHHFQGKQLTVFVINSKTRVSCKIRIMENISAIVNMRTASNT